MLRCTADSGASQHRIEKNIATVGRLMRVRTSIYVPGANTLGDGARLYNRSWGNYLIDDGNGLNSSWRNVDEIFVGIHIESRWYLTDEATNTFDSDGDLIYFYGVIVDRFTEPAATGIHILDGPGGSEAWAEIDSSFNYNDIVEIEILPAATAQGVTLNSVSIQ